VPTVVYPVAFDQGIEAGRWVGLAARVGMPGVAILGVCDVKFGCTQSCRASYHAPPAYVTSRLYCIPPRHKALALCKPRCRIIRMLALVASVAGETQAGDPVETRPLTLALFNDAEIMWVYVRVGLVGGWVGRSHCCVHTWDVTML
jgi:hypothetical protein